VIAQLLIALFALFASWHDTPADAAPPPAVSLPAPVTERARPTTPHYAPPAAPPVQAMTEQLPEESTGRQVDCPDGAVGTQDAAGGVAC
jgi:hypothetical protein